jgi:hypothetical protein
MEKHCGNEDGSGKSECEHSNNEKHKDKELVLPHFHAGRFRNLFLQLKQLLRDHA